MLSQMFKHMFSYDVNDSEGMMGLFGKISSMFGMTHECDSLQDNPVLVKKRKRIDELTNHRPRKKRRIVQDDQEYENFIKRLKKNANIEELNPLLENIFHLQDFKNIFSYVLSQHKQAISNLEAGESIRFAKNDTNLTRNIQVVRSKSGKFRLFVESNTRAKNGRKELKDAVCGQGTFKKVMKCYRIDSINPKAWACSKIKKDLESAVKEAEIVNSLSHPYIVQFSMGQKYKGDKKLALYSKLAVGTLNDVITGDIDCNPLEKEELMLQILSAVAYMHEKNIIHQDIKPENILIYNKNGTLKAQLTDFGLAVKENDFDRSKILIPLATSGYESPQILNSYKNPRSFYHNYFFNQNTSLAQEVFRVLSQNNVRIKSLPTVSKTNDCWALGIMYYELMYGITPTLEQLNNIPVRGNEVMFGLLEVDPYKRLSSTKALESIKDKIEEFTTGHYIYDRCSYN